MAQSVGFFLLVLFYTTWNLEAESTDLAHRLCYLLIEKGALYHPWSVVFILRLPHGHKVTATCPHSRQAGRRRGGGGNGGGKEEEGDPIRVKIHNGEIYSNRKLISDCQGLGEGELERQEVR